MKINKAFLIYNSGAGKNRSAKYAKKLIEEFSSRGISAQGFESNSRETDQEFSKILEKSEGNIVVCLGGDGTLGAVVRTLYENKIDMPIAVFPCGTANDFATAGRVPKNTKRFVDFLLSAEPVTTDIARVFGSCGDCSVDQKPNETYVINAVGSGNFSNGVTVYSSRAKRFFGKFGYYIQCVIEFFKMKSCVLNFDCDGEQFSENTLMYYFVNAERAGGFDHFAPMAKINDGQFNLVVVKKCGFFACIGLFAQILFGKHLKNKHIVVKEVKRATVTGGEAHQKFYRCDIDGNAGPSGSLNVEVIKGGAKIFIKQNSHKINKK